MPFDVAWWIECNSRIRRCICRSFYTFVWSGTLLAKAGFLIFIFGLRQAGCSLALERHLGPSSRLLILVDLCPSPCLIWPRRSRIGQQTSADSAPFSQESSAHPPLSYPINHFTCYILRLFHRSKLLEEFQTPESFREYLSNLCRAELVYSRHTASRQDNRLATF